MLPNAALSGCNQPHEAYNRVGIHQRCCWLLWNTRRCTMKFLFSTLIFSTNFIKSSLHWIL